MSVSQKHVSSAASRSLHNPARRRFLCLMGGATAGALCLSPAYAVLAEQKQQLYRWRGILFGSEARLQLYDKTPYRARHLLHMALTEIKRLEAIFSLYQPDSALAQLNRESQLTQAPPELTEVLKAANRYHAETGGAFDVTIQPVWQLYQRHFSDPSRTEPPTEDAIAAARRNVGQHRIRLHDNRIVIAPHTQVTLNGIAQGYITDKITQLLHKQGMEHVLVELGETRALGTHPDGAPWQLGIRQASQPEQIANIIALTNRALATSGGYGTSFDASGQYHHLLDPRTGQAVHEHASVSVEAPSAMQADAFSTALAVMPRAELARFVARHPDIAVHLQPLDSTS